ncbi:MAG: helix-turn-helix transcriptional regulator [Cyclobacteriaceae bacterium]
MSLAKLKSFQKAIDLKIHLGDKTGLIGSYSNYAMLLSDMGKITAAFGQLEKADSLTELVGDNLFAVTNLQTKASILEKTGRLSEANAAIKQAMGMLTEALNEDRNKKIAEWEVKFETAMREAEISNLKLANELERTNALKARSQLIGAIVVGVLLLLFLLIFFSLRLRKKEAERIAQESQLDALQKRFIEIQGGLTALDMDLDYEELNGKLHNALTEREFEVLKLSLDGKSNSEIAKSLFISISTVKFHLRNNYNKLGVQNRKEAMEYVIKSS